MSNRRKENPIVGALATGDNRNNTLGDRLANFLPIIAGESTPEPSPTSSLSPSFYLSLFGLYNTDDSHVNLHIRRTPLECN